MIRYTYKAVTKENKIVAGEITAFGSIFARRKLLADGLSVIILAADENSPLKKFFSLSFGGFSRMERILFFRNLAMMVDAGLSLAESLEVLRDQVKSSHVKKSLDSVKAGILNGQPLSALFARYPKYFSPFIYETVRVGELSGTLAKTLERISENLEKEYELRRKVMGAIAYPCIVLTVMLLVGGVISVYVLPRVRDMFTEFGAELPAITRALLAVSGFIQEHFLLLISALVLAVIAFILLMRVENVRHFVHSISLRLPIFGQLLKEANLAHFFRSVNSLIASGISVVHAVEVANKTLANEAYKRALNKVCPILLYGVPLTDALKSYPHLFPNQARRVLAVGEQTGKFGESFRRVSDYYEKSIMHKTAMITALVEPILMVLAGIMIGALALSIFMPLYQVAEVI